jgi:hypothetical protein
MDREQELQGLAARLAQELYGADYWDLPPHLQQEISRLAIEYYEYEEEED